MSYLDSAPEPIGLKLALGVALLGLVVVVVSTCACVGWLAQMLYNFTSTKALAGVEPSGPLWHDQAGSIDGYGTVFALNPEK